MIAEANAKQLKNLMYNIVWLRRYHRISKKRMAKLLGIGVGSLNRLERGELPPRVPVDAVFNLHDQFGYPMGKLLVVCLGEDNTKIVSPPSFPEKEL